jgi:phosphopentomutase
MSRPEDRRRAAVVVIDACGAGALPDADAYGDPPDANTIAHVAEAVGGLRLPTLERLGLGSIVPVAGVPPAAEPVVHGRLHPLGPGKDSTTGHWELMGVVAPRPLPTYPDGFPPDVVADLERATGLRFCGNRPADGLAIIEDLGAHHLETGEVIPTPRRTRCCSSPRTATACPRPTSTPPAPPRGR